MTRSYVPGEWYALLGPDLVLALPPGSRDLAASAWSALDRGAGADEVLDLVLAGGLSGLSGFALVSTHDGRTRALARGRAVCLLVSGEQETVADGRSVSTWVEVSVEDVSAISVEVGQASDGPPLSVGDGLVRASRVLWPAQAQPAAAGPAAPPEPEPEPGDVPAPVPDPEPLTEPAPVADLALAGAHDHEVTEGDPEPRPIWQPIEDDHDGRTQDGSWGADLAAAQHAIPGQPPAPAVTARPVAALLLSTGERIDVDRVVVLGRAPEARRFTSTEQPRLVTVPSPQQEISSTHLEVRPGSGADHGSAVVTDLGSTNGTVLVQPGLPAESLKPGIPVQLLPGAVVDLGDGLSITVTHP